MKLNWKSFLSLLAMVALILSFSAASAQGTTIHMADKHISIRVPIGWSYERNSTSGGIIYDLEMLGPWTGDYRPVTEMLVLPWPGKVSNSTLYAEAENLIEELESYPEITNFTVVSRPQNLTLNGEKAIDMTVRFTTIGVSIRERTVVVASESWKLSWILYLFAVDSLYANWSSTFNDIVNSLTADKKESAALSLPTVLAYMGLGGIVAVIVAVLLILTRRKKRPQLPFPPPPTMPPHVGVPSAPPAPPGPSEEFPPKAP